MFIEIIRDREDRLTQQATLKEEQDRIRRHQRFLQQV
jgi:hypothetical protein